LFDNSIYSKIIFKEMWCSMEQKINFKKIIDDNLELAVSIQNEIFPDEDGRENFIECVEHNPYRKELDFYIAYDGDLPFKTQMDDILEIINEVKDER